MDGVLQVLGGIACLDGKDEPAASGCSTIHWPAEGSHMYCMHFSPQILFSSSFR